MTPAAAPAGRLGIFPGSFDPLTNGHVDLILRSAHLFERLTVAVLVNAEKQPLFTAAERVTIIREVFREYPNVEVDTFDGLLVEYARQRRASAIIRGLRAVSDFEYEFQMALMNRHLEPTLETVFMMPAEQYTYLSSRLIKEVFSLGGEVRGLVPPAVEQWMRQKHGTGVRGRGRMSMFAQRLAQVSASATLKVAAEAERLRRAGFDVVDFSAGEPDFPTPEHVKAAGKAAIDANFTRYTVAAGIPELREAICARYKRDYGIDVTPAEVLLTAGGKQALFNAALALFQEGDEVITHAPYWPTIPEQVKLVGAKPVIVSTRADDGFAVHAEKMIAAITPRTKGIIINSPCNPTGALVDEATTSAIADAAAKQGIWVIVDLCYEQLIYEPVPHNLPKVLFDKHRSRTVLAGSASKAYAMTGWRCGWTIAPKELTAAFNVIQGQTTSNITSITQKAALAAVEGPQDSVVTMLNEYRKRRDNIHAWLTENPGITCVKPSGAFYLFPNISGLLTKESGLATSTDFAQKLLEKEYVVVTPGEAFDAPGYLRISYATSMEKLREGATRILRFAESLQPARASAGR